MNSQSISRVMEFGMDQEWVIRCDFSLVFWNKGVSIREDYEINRFFRFLWEWKTLFNDFIEGELINSNEFVSCSCGDGGCHGENWNLLLSESNAIWEIHNRFSRPKKYSNIIVI